MMNEYGWNRRIIITFVTAPFFGVGLYFSHKFFGVWGVAPVILIWLVFSAYLYQKTAYHPEPQLQFDREKGKWDRPKRTP